MAATGPVLGGMSYGLPLLPMVFMPRLGNPGYLASMGRNSGPSLIEHILGSVEFCGEGRTMGGNAGGPARTGRERAVEWVGTNAASA